MLCAQLLDLSVDKMHVTYSSILCLMVAWESTDGKWCQLSTKSRYTGETGLTFQNGLQTTFIAKEALVSCLV